MKTFLMTLALASTLPAFAKDLHCSVNGQTLDDERSQPTHQIVFKGSVDAQGTIRGASLADNARTDYGFSARSSETLESRTNGNYVRFWGSDNWNNYKIALPVGFQLQSRTTAYLDIYRDGVSGYRTVKLNCTIK